MVRTPGARRAEERPLLFLLLSIGVTAALYVIPYGFYIGYPLMLLSTFVHEMGHGIAGMLVGAHFASFEMWSDGSGIAHVTGYDGAFRQAFVSAGGLCGPACAAGLGFILARRAAWARVTLLSAGALLLLVDVWVVRSLFGVVFVAALAALLIAIGAKGRTWGAQLALLFLSVELALSVYSRGDYLFTDVAQTHAGDFPSDVANMSHALFLPYWFWGATCGLFSIGVLAVGATIFMRGAVRDVVPSHKPRPRA